MMLGSWGVVEHHVGGSVRPCGAWDSRFPHGWGVGVARCRHCEATVAWVLLSCAGVS